MDAKLTSLAVASPWSLIGLPALTMQEIVQIVFKTGATNSVLSIP